MNRASFGATQEDAAALMATGYSGWIKQEFAKPANPQLPRLLANAMQINANIFAPDEGYITWEDFVREDDQLRQRMMFALSQILVVGDMTGAVAGRPFALGYYRDQLLNNAFGNYRDLLEDVTYSPAMAAFLTYMRNQKEDLSINRLPDENYAREIMQLFTIGLFELNIDGSMKLDANGEPIPTYDNGDVQGLARVFTGLSLKGSRFGFQDFDGDGWRNPVEIFPTEHEPGEKAFLSTVIPANTSAADSIDQALDALVDHPNTAPFIAKQLIQRFVTSSPSPGYIARVATAFADGRFTLLDGDSVGDGRRGDLSATLAAVLLDPEALQPVEQAPDAFGKVKEPVIRFTQWARAFDVNSADADNEDVLADASGADTFAQHPFRASSVFNFFRPGYIKPGSQTAAAGLTAPELQIVDASTVTGYAATIGRYIRDDRSRNQTQAPANYVPDYTDELALADDTDALIDHLDELLVNGALQPETRANIAQMMSYMAGTTQADRLARVRVAIWMVMNAPEFLVQR